jgi:hypothetical protein
MSDKQKAFHLNNDSDYGGVRGYIRQYSMWCIRRDHVLPKVIQDGRALSGPTLVLLYLPISHQGISTNTYSLVLKIAVYVHIHVY